MLLASAFLASRLLLPPQRTIDAMAVVDFGPSLGDLRWTLGPGLGLAYHVKETDVWAAMPLAISGPGRDLPIISLRDVRPVSRVRVRMPLGETVWLASAGHRVSDLVVAPDAFLRFSLNDASQRLSARFPLADCVRR